MSRCQTTDRVILDLCGGTGSWSQPYRHAGYTVLVVDPRAGDFGDVRLLRYDSFAKPVHGVLCAPPCQHFSSSGARWWASKGEGALLDALSIVDACLRIVTITKPKWWALENPTGRLKHYIGPYRYSFDPCDFGDPYTKRTHLWGEFSEPVKNPVPATEGSKMHRLPPSPDRNRLRSITPAGFAQAFFEANQ